MTDIYFWLNSPSIHQAPLIKEISFKHQHKIYAIIENDVSEKRKNMGWKMPDFGNAKVFVTPNRKARVDLIKSVHSKSVHLFSGLDAYPETYYTLKCLSVKDDITRVIMLEPGRHDQGLKSTIRLIKHKCMAYKWRDKVDKVLVTGHNGVKWWSRAGFYRQQIYEWGYFVDYASIEKEKQVNKTDEFEIVVVASLIKLKNHQLLINALSKLNNYTVSIIGDGPEKENLKELSLNLGISHKLNFKGLMPNKDVIKQIVSADLLVLPSRYDGWGAVVNEALSVGTPVICSDACGSSVLINDYRLGSVFKSNDVHDLTTVLNKSIEEGKLTNQRRNWIKEWAKNSISPKAASEYFERILCTNKNLNKIESPWS